MTDFRGAPGVYAGPSLNSRNIFASHQPNQVQAVPTVAQIDGSLSRDTGEVPTSLIRSGNMLGKIAASGLYRPSIIGLMSAAALNTDTTLTVSAAVATELARLIALAGGNVNIKVIGPPAAAGVVAVTSATVSGAAGTTLTLTGALGVAKAAGSAVCPADGSQTPVTVLPDQYGIDVVDRLLNNINQPIHTFLRGADLLASMIVNLVADDNAVSADTSVQAYFKTQLKAAGYFTFDNDR